MQMCQSFPRRRPLAGLKALPCYLVRIIHSQILLDIACSTLVVVQEDADEEYDETKWIV